MTDHQQLINNALDEIKARLKFWLTVIFYLQIVSALIWVSFPIIWIWDNFLGALKYSFTAFFVFLALSFLRRILKRTTMEIIEDYINNHEL